MSSAYKLDRDDSARARLSLLERLEDPATIAVLEGLGVNRGWRCLEAGAGGGSIARWLRSRVGPDGHVTALDQDVQRLEPLRREGIEVREHDLVKDSIEEASYDLVHTRQVLVHIPERDAVLTRLLRAVKPGGFVLLEEPDSRTDGPDPSAPEEQQELYHRVVASIYRFLEAAGLETTYGARVLGALRRAGFAELESSGRVRVFQGGQFEGGSPHLMAFRQIRAELVAHHVVSDEDLDRLLALGQDPGFAWRETMILATSGRRPA